MTFHLFCNHDHSAMGGVCTGGGIPTMSPTTEREDGRGPLSEEEKQVRRATVDTVRTKFQRAILLCGLFLVVEVVGGYLAGSLAVLSDASHLFSDLASMAVSLAASYVAELPKERVEGQFTYGLKRVESLAALLSMLSLIAVSLYLIFSAVVRLFLHQPGDEVVDGAVMSLVAIIGVVVNIALALVLGEHHAHLPGDTSHQQEHQMERSTRSTTETTSCDSSDSDKGDELDEEVGRMGSCDGDEDDRSDMKHFLPSQQQYEDAPAETSSWIPILSACIPSLPENINLRATYLHVLGDLLQSTGVLLGGLLIWKWPSVGWWVDPICTLVFCILVLWSTIPVIRSSLAVLLLRVPGHIDYFEMHLIVESIPTVDRIESLHIWSVSHDVPALSVRLLSSAASSADDDVNSIVEAVQEIAERFGVADVTVQVLKTTSPPPPAISFITGRPVSSLGLGCLPCGPSRK